MKISVFSKHFIECHHRYLLGTQPYREDITPPTIGNAFAGWLARKDEHWCPQLFMSLHPENEIVDKAIFNRICADYNLGKIEKWATNNILLQDAKDWKQKTKNVKMRIVAGMLNKLENSGHITHDENTYMFNNIVNNMRDLRSDILDEELPF